MPKVTEPNALIREFGGNSVWTYNLATKSLFCKLCTTSCPANRRCTVAQHVQTKRHKEKLKLQQDKDKGISVQTILGQVMPRVSPFTQDLAKMMVECNIPLNNVEKTAFQDFIKKHCQESVPSRWSMSQAMEKEARAIMEKIKET